ETYDLPVAPVNDIAEVFTDPQVLARDMVRQYRHPVLGDLSYLTSPVKLSRWRHPNQSAPMLGEHTAEVLMKKMNYSPEAIEGLVDQGVVHTAGDHDGRVAAGVGS
ncbi:MAG: CoA transferase, partial [bacterium]|nr:CoA transferase [bacterium]